MDLKGLQTYRTIQFSMNQGRLHVPKIYQITRQPFPTYPSRGQKIREPILFSQLGLADLSYLLHQQPTETHPNCQNFLQVFFEHLQPLPCPLPSPSSTSLTPLSSLPRVTGPRIYPTQRLTQELCESFLRFLHTHEDQQGEGPSPPAIQRALPGPLHCHPAPSHKPLHPSGRRRNTPLLQTLSDVLSTVHG